MSVVVKLAQPIQAHGQTLTELTLQEPRGKDIAACGLPRLFTRRGETVSIVTDTAVVHAYIVKLGNIPPPSADALCASDWSDVADAVMSFFSKASPAPAPVETVVREAPQAGIAMPFQTPASPETTTSSPSS